MAEREYNESELDCRMSWTEIKHAINSTVGTNKFKPLDEVIKGLVGFMADDTQIFGTYDLGTDYVGEHLNMPFKQPNVWVTATAPKTIKLDAQGTIKLSASVNYNQGNVQTSHPKVRGTLYKNGVLISQGEETASIKHPSGDVKIFGQCVCNNRQK